MGAGTGRNKSAISRWMWSQESAANYYTIHRSPLSHMFPLHHPALLEEKKGGVIKWKWEDSRPHHATACRAALLWCDVNAPSLLLRQFYYINVHRQPNSWIAIIECVTPIWRCDSRTPCVVMVPGSGTESDTGNLRYKGFLNALRFILDTVE